MKFIATVASVSAFLLCGVAHAESLDITCRDEASVVLRAETSGLNYASYTEGANTVTFRQLRCDTLYTGDVRHHIVIHCFNAATQQVVNFETISQYDLSDEASPQSPTSSRAYRVRFIDHGSNERRTFQFRAPTCTNDSEYDA